MIAEPVCAECRRPVEQLASGWFTHIDLRGDCLRLMDACDVEPYDDDDDDDEVTS
jgi:hypothetical protein